MPVATPADCALEFGGTKLLLDEGKERMGVHIPVALQSNANLREKSAKK